MPPIYMRSPAGQLIVINELFSITMSVFQVLGTFFFQCRKLSFKFIRLVLEISYQCPFFIAEFFISRLCHLIG